MISNYSLKHHYKPQKGWMNDPNGLVYFDGYYHAFYQHAPNFEAPWHEPMVWGHARTRDFIEWEELPIALSCGETYDSGGCWSGTAVVKDDVLYLLYASVIHEPEDNSFTQTVSVAFSQDGIHFEKYENNPVIREYPADGSPDFRDPAIYKENGKYYCVMASGNKEAQEARLLLYESEDMFNWKYDGVMAQWQNSVFCECPSFVKCGDKYMLTTSVCEEDNHYFSIMYGDFDGYKFTAEVTGQVMCGPDEYAGQVFCDDQGRDILMSWISGWSFSTFAEKSLGCLSLPIELTVKDGKVYGYPVKEVQHLLKDSDPLVEVTEDGFVVKREQLDDVVYKGEITDLKILRDEYVMEIFVNKGEHIYVAVIC